MWPALRAQLLLWRSMHAGFRPARPQHRRGQAPLAEPPVTTTGFSWSPFRPTLACFSIGDDCTAFLSLEAQDPDLREARLSSESFSGDSPKLPACLRKQPPSELTFDSRPEAEAPPSWREGLKEACGPTPEIAQAAIKPQATASHRLPCSTVRFLLSTSGIAHSCISHPGSRMSCLACNDTACIVQCGVTLLADVFLKFLLFHKCP